MAQLHARAPVDIRAWRRVRSPRLAKTLALFGKAGLLVDEMVPSLEVRDAAEDALAELDADRSAGDRAWGYPFAVQTRWSSYAADSPNVVATSFAIESLLFGAERLDQHGYLSRAREAGEWLVETLLTPRGHFAYHEHSDALIHNANLLGAAATYRATGDVQSVARAIELTLDAQHRDGAWPYGEGSRLGFIDNFHTGYVLKSLMDLREIDPAIDHAIERGARFWSNHFFDPEGRALLWPDRRFPQDGHSTGTALTTLAQLARMDSTYFDLLERVAKAALAQMITNGRAVHRRYRWGRTFVTYLRWCDGHVAAGMAAASRASTVASPPSDEQSHRDY